MKARKISQYLTKLTKSPINRILVFTGARQTGKTTLAKRLFPNYAYLAIDDPAFRVSLPKLTAAQWNTLYPKAVLDEVQKQPLLIDSVKAAADLFPDTRFLLTGSSQFLLLEKVRESLAGRCVIEEVYPLTLPELRTTAFDDKAGLSWFAAFILGETAKTYPSFTLHPGYAQCQRVFDHYLRFGGYPALTDDELTDDEREEWLISYTRTFLERDIRDLASFRDLEPFVKLQRYLANTTAEPVNYTSIAKETGVSVPTVQRYIRYMGISYQSVILPAWFANPLKRLARAPKIHFLDCGVLRAVLRKRGGVTGGEFESAVVAEIFKQIKAFGLPLSCYHFRTSDGREVDLLLEAEDYFLAVEVKQSDHVSRTDARHLFNLQQFLGKPLKHAFILSNDVEMHSFSASITAMHAAAFLA
jgi:predicted AAA+ superfamily ATPase